MCQSHSKNLALVCSSSVSRIITIFSNHPLWTLPLLIGTEKTWDGTRTNFLIVLHPLNNILINLTSQAAIFPDTCKLDTFFRSWIPSFPDAPDEIFIDSLFCLEPSHKGLISVIYYRITQIRPVSLEKIKAAGKQDLNISLLDSAWDAMSTLNWLFSVLSNFYKMLVDPILNCFLYNTFLSLS